MQALITVSCMTLIVITFSLSSLLGESMLNNYFRRPYYNSRGNSFYLKQFFREPLESRKREYLQEGETTKSCNLSPKRGEYCTSKAIRSISRRICIPYRVHCYGVPELVIPFCICSNYWRYPTVGETMKVINVRHDPESL